MNAPSAADLVRKSCVPCEGGVPPVPPDQARAMLAGLPGWDLTADGLRLRRHWVVKKFTAGIGYRDVAVEIWTHAIGGLSENDFILAAKINELPVAVKKEEKGGPS